MAEITTINSGTNQNEPVTDDKTVLVLENSDAVLLFKSDGEREMFVPKIKDGEHVTRGMYEMMLCVVMLEDANLRKRAETLLASFN